MFIHQILAFHVLSPGTADFHGKESCLFTWGNTVVENKVPREIFDTKKNVAGEWGKWHEELYVYSLINWRIFGGWNEVVLDRRHMHLHGENNKFTYCVEILMGEPEQKKLFWIYRRRYDVIMGIKPIGMMVYGLNWYGIGFKG